MARKRGSRQGTPWRGFFGLTAEDLFRKAQRDLAACEVGEELDSFINAIFSLNHLHEWIVIEHGRSVAMDQLAADPNYKVVRSLATVGKHAEVENPKISEVRSYVDEHARVEESRTGDPIEGGFEGGFPKVERSDPDVRTYLYAVMRSYCDYFEARGVPRKPE